MAKKIFILLFVTIFCNGYTYSSPVSGQQILGVPLPEEKPPTEDHINKKTESAVVPTVQPTPKTNATNPQSPVLQNATAHPALPSSSVTPQVVNKNGTGNASLDPVVKPTNQSKDASQTVDVKTMNQTTDAKNISQSTEPGKNGGLPVDEKNKTMTTTAAPGKINTDIPAPSQPGQTTPSTTNSTPAPPSTTTPTPATAKPTVSTLSPTPVVEHTVPAPAQEKHFDGPSFIGGIVLTIGLTAIGFIAFKYYKSGKIDINYRTL